MTNNEKQIAHNNGEIGFDPNSGISEEEQREILVKINGIAEQNRRSLLEKGAVAAGKKERFKAKKSGGLFPALVNVAALALLAGGFLLLSSFQGKTDARVREGAAIYNSAERALIEEIRKETASRIAVKETEISQIVSQLEGVDAELRELHSSNQDLSAEQRATEERLRRLQDEYRQSLSSLQDERSRILEDSRARESNLRAQLEERSRELAAVSEQNRAALEQRDAALEQRDAAVNAARSELERLASDQEKAAAIEAQLGGYLASVNSLVRGGQFTEAAETLKTMRSFLNTPSFAGIRLIQAKKELYAQAISSLEAVLDETRKNQGGAAAGAAGGDTEKAIAELEAKNARLEETVAGLEKTIAAAGSQGSGLAQRLGELENSASALRNINTLLETSVAEKDRTISSLEAEKTELSQSVAARDNNIRELQGRTAAQEAEIANLNSQLAQIRQALQALSQ